MEGEVIRLKNILLSNGYADNGSEEDYKPAKVIYQLNQRIKKLEEKNKKLEDVRDAATQIHNLQSVVDSFPLRLYKAKYFKDIIKKQERYINELEELLEKNNISFCPRIPYDLDIKDMETAIENAERFMDANKGTTESLEG